VLLRLKLHRIRWDLCSFKVYSHLSVMHYPIDSRTFAFSIKSQTRSDSLVVETVESIDILTTLKYCLYSIPLDVSHFSSTLSV